VRDSRRIAALRALADRPGTEAEGRVAKEKLRRALEAAGQAQDPVPPKQAKAADSFGRTYTPYYFDRNLLRRQAEDLLRRQAERMSKEPFEGRAYQSHREQETERKARADHYGCPCGSVWNRELCANKTANEHIRKTLTEKFPTGTRVYYNGPLFPPNKAGSVIDDYYKDCAWNQLMVKFEDGSDIANFATYSGTKVNAFHCGEMRLSTEPIHRERHA